MPQIFPKWSNTASKVFPFALLGFVALVVFVFWYWFSPKNLDVGYRPAQPIILVTSFTYQICKLTACSAIAWQNMQRPPEFPIRKHAWCAMNNKQIKIYYPSLALCNRGMAAAKMACPFHGNG